MLSSLADQLRRPATSSPACLRRGDPGLGPLPDDGSLELRDAAEDMEDKAPAWGAGVDRFGYRLQRDAAMLQIFHGLDKLLQGSGQTIETPDDEGVTGPHVVKRGGELRPVLPSAADRLQEQLLAPGGSKRILLHQMVLIDGRNAPVTNQHFSLQLYETLYVFYHPQLGFVQGLRTGTGSTNMRFDKMLAHLSEIGRLRTVGLGRKYGFRD